MKAVKPAESPLVASAVTPTRIMTSAWRWVQRQGTAYRQSRSLSSETVRRPRYPSCVGKYAWQLDEIKNAQPAPTPTDRNEDGPRVRVDGRSGEI
jgi:hypothetical protein